MKFEIKNRWTGRVIFECEAVSLKAAVEEAVSTLRGSDLRGSDLSGSNLRGIKNDFFNVLLHAPKEVAGLRLAITEGRVDGSAYEGECACLVGTIANVRGCKHTELVGLPPDAYRPAEQFFLAIREGQTPENNRAAAVVVGWIDEFQTLLQNAQARQEKA